MELQPSALARRALERAPELARDQNFVVSSAHLMLAILECERDDESRFGQILLLGGFKREELELYARAWQSAHARNSFVDERNSFVDEAKPGDDFKTALAWTANEAQLAGNTHIGPEHLFLALLRAQRGEHVGEVLRPLGRDLGFLRDSLRGLGASNSPYPRGHPLGMLGASGVLAIEAAQVAMRQTFCGRISTAHLLLGVLSTKPNRATQVLEACDVSIDELQIAARAAISADGELASSTKKFDNGAKRALERAKSEARARGQVFIESEHVLVGLLPHRATWRERRLFGNIVDPLERVWENVLASVDEDELQALLERETAPVLSSTNDSESTESVRVDWRFALVGALWWSWLLAPVAVDLRVAMIGGGFLLGLIAAALGDSLKRRALVHRAASFVIGMSVGVGVLFFLGGILVTRR